MNKICILGQGYIGLPTAIMFATHGLQVVGVEVDEDILHTLSSGGLHIHEPGLRELFDLAIDSGRLTFSRNVTEADAFIITVPTPFLRDRFGENNGHRYKKADMAFVECATEMIVPYLKRGNLVVLESTSPPRTTCDLVRPILERTGLEAGADFSLVYCPERVLPGKILKELVENPRVIGGINATSAQAGRRLYASFVQGEMFLTDATTAEMVKLMENTYRDINIAIANEFSTLADRFGVHILEAIEIANHHPRVKILSPGIGVGGHCISVDPWFLVESAPDITPLISTARLVNDSRPGHVAEAVLRLLGAARGRTVAALGLAYKPNVDDLRESPAVEVCRLLVNAGENVIAFEPCRPAAQFNEFSTASSLETALQFADMVLVLVAHDEFLEMTPEAMSAITRARTVLDAVRIWDRNAWRDKGFAYHSLGENVDIPSYSDTSIP